MFSDPGRHKRSRIYGFCRNRTRCAFPVFSGDIIPQKANDSNAFRVRKPFAFRSPTGCQDRSPRCLSCPRGRDWGVKAVIVYSLKGAFRTQRSFREAAATGAMYLFGALPCSVIPNYTPFICFRVGINGYNNTKCRDVSSLLPESRYRKDTTRSFVQAASD